jgi:hypothetical protein
MSQFVRIGDVLVQHLNFGIRQRVERTVRPRDPLVVVQHHNLQATSLGISGLDEGEQVGVDGFGLRHGHAVREPAQVRIMALFGGPFTSLTNH